MIERSESPDVGLLSPADKDDAPIQAGVKRKIEADGEKPVSKRAAKRKRKAAATPSAYDEIDETKGINPAIARMDGALLADHVARQTQRFEKDLSAVELEDLRIPGALYSFLIASDANIVGAHSRLTILPFVQSRQSRTPAAGQARESLSSCPLF